MELNKPNEINRHQGRWPQIIIMLVAVGTFLWTLRKEGRWLLIVPIFLIVLSAVLLIRDSGLFNRIIKRYRLKKKYRIGDREAKKLYSRFVLLVEKSELFRYLMDYLDRSEWNTKDYCPQLGNILFVNRYNDILETAKGLKIKHLDEMKLISQRFRDFLDSFNEHYIQTFSIAYKLGQAKYPNEDIKKKVVQLKRQYDSFLYDYNDFCKEVNSRCGISVLVPFFSIPPDLDWEKGDKL